MKIQTKPKDAGPVIEAVQFLGDPSVAPKWIYWCPEEDIGKGRKNKAHWRCGGESHGGPYDSSSSWLEVGDWLLKDAESGDIRIIHPAIFDRDWRIVSGGGIELDERAKVQMAAGMLLNGTDEQKYEALHYLNSLGNSRP